MFCVNERMINMIRNNVDLKKEVMHGWTVGDFVRAILPEADAVMQGRGNRAPFLNRGDFAMWCSQRQPLTQKAIPEVVEFFAVRYNLI